MKIRILLIIYCITHLMSVGFAQATFYEDIKVANVTLKENNTSFSTGQNFSYSNFSFHQQPLIDSGISAEWLIKPFSKTVRFKIKKMHIYDDGDRGFEGAGDFVWVMKVNKQIISEEKKEITLKTGATHIIDRSIELSLAYSLIEKIVFEAFITEKDGGFPSFSGDDDVLPPITVTYSIEELIKKGRISESRRVDLKGSPDVEVFYTIEVLD